MQLLKLYIVFIFAISAGIYAKDINALYSQYKLNDSQKLIANQLIREWKTPYGIDVSIYEAYVKDYKCNRCADILEGIVYYTSLGKSKYEITDTILEQLDAELPRIDFAEAARVYDIPVGDSPVIGAQNAVVTLVVYSDYGCGHCKYLHPKLLDYMKVNKTTRVVFKFLTSSANELPVKAGYAAHLQGKYREMAEVLFAAEKVSLLGETVLVDMAAKAGLDPARFKADLASKRVAEIYAADRELAERLHVRGTPELFNNGKRIRIPIDTYLQTNGERK